MPRTGRVVLPNFPHHIVQRGHNRQPVFAGAEDCRFYLAILREWVERLGCRLYAYCLMTNHVHLVIDPGDHGKSLGALMKRVAARQTRRVNKRDERSGTLWESRFRSSPIDTERYLLACCRYVELNPVRAAMASDPAEYPWSSYRERIGIAPSRLLDALPAAAGLQSVVSVRTVGVPSENDGERSPASRYREWVLSPVPPGEWASFRLAVKRGQLTGDADFAQEVCERIGHRIATRGPGNPGGTRGKRATPGIKDVRPTSAK
jgi:putative transposase